MTTEILKVIAVQKLSIYSIEELKQEVIKLNNDFREGVDIIIQATLDILESKMESAEFINFCESL